MFLRQILCEEVYYTAIELAEKIKLPRAHSLWKYDSLLPLFRYLFPPLPPCSALM